MARFHSALYVTITGSQTRDFMWAYGSCPAGRQGSMCKHCVFLLKHLGVLSMTHMRGFNAQVEFPTPTPSIQEKQSYEEAVLSQDLLLADCVRNGKVSLPQASGGNEDDQMQDNNSFANPTEISGGDSVHAPCAPTPCKKDHMTIETMSRLINENCKSVENAWSNVIAAGNPRSVQICFHSCMHHLLQATHAAESASHISVATAPTGPNIVSEEVPAASKENQCKRKIGLAEHIENKTRTRNRVNKSTTVVSTSVPTGHRPKKRGRKCDSMTDMKHQTRNQSIPQDKSMHIVDMLTGERRLIRHGSKVTAEYQTRFKGGEISWQPHEGLEDSFSDVIHGIDKQYTKLAFSSKPPKTGVQVGLRVIRYVDGVRMLGVVAQIDRRHQCPCVVIYKDFEFESATIEWCRKNTHV